MIDPACGSGSLLLKSAKILGKDNVRNGFFGQEINLTTYNLCRINMFLHDIDYDKFDIACEDTLTSPQHWDDEPFEVIVSNPPYSIKWAGDDNAVLIITHNTRILNHLKVDYVHVLVNGQIVKTSTAELAEQIEETGYAQYKK